MNRRKLMAIWVAVIVIMMVRLEITPMAESKDLYNYITSSFEETGAANAVAAIYLDYRMFDTIFETLTLLISVIAVIYFSRHEGDY